MIIFWLIGILAAAIAFWLTKRLPLVARITISTAIIISAVGYSLHLFSKIDEPPPGSRIVTQEEIESWSK